MTFSFAKSRDTTLRIDSMEVYSAIRSRDTDFRDTAYAMLLCDLLVACVHPVSRWPHSAHLSASMSSMTIASFALVATALRVSAYPTRMLVHLIASQSPRALLASSPSLYISASDGAIRRRASLLKMHALPTPNRCSIALLALLFWAGFSGAPWTRRSLGTASLPSRATSQGLTTSSRVSIPRTYQGNGHR
jgi:hypothetical protein